MPRHAVEQRTKREIVEDMLNGPAVVRPDFGALPVSFRLSCALWINERVEHQVEMIKNLDGGQISIMEATIDILGARYGVNLVSVNSAFRVYKARDYLSPQSDEIESTSLLNLASSMSDDDKFELAAVLLIDHFKEASALFSAVTDTRKQLLSVQSSIVAQKATVGYDILVAGQCVINTSFITGPTANSGDYEHMKKRFSKAVFDGLEFARDTSLD